MGIRVKGKMHLLICLTSGPSKIGIYVKSVGYRPKFHQNLISKSTFYDKTHFPIQFLLVKHESVAK